MVPYRSTRRNVLALSGLALAGLAGCGARGADGPRSDVGADGGDTPSETATERTYANEATTLASRTVRNPAGNPAVRSSAHEPATDVTPSGDVETSAGWNHEYWFVTTSEERDALTYSSATTSVASAKSFVADTDLSEASNLIQQYAVEECTTVDVRRIRWNEVNDGPESAIDLRVEYEDRERDGNCEHDAENDSGHEGEEHAKPTVVEATITRIPVPIETVRSFAYGW